MLPIVADPVRAAQGRRSPNRREVRGGEHPDRGCDLRPCRATVETDKLAKVIGTEIANPDLTT